MRPNPTTPPTPALGGGGDKTLVRACLALVALFTALLAAFALTLNPTHAQTPGPPANIEISEPLGSLAIDSYFYLIATVTDINGNPVADETPVTWEVVPPRPGPLWLGASSFGTREGRDRASAYVTANGIAQITATSGAAGQTTTVSIDAPTAQPPAPARVVLWGALTLQPLGDPLTVHALVTDANGAPVPDGTPISWEMIRTSGERVQDAAISEDRTTMNGTASATWQSGEFMLATATAGDVSGTSFLPSYLGTIILISDKPEWTLLEIGDTVTVTGTFLDPGGAAAVDSTEVSWHASGPQPPLRWLDQVPRFDLVSSDTETISGSASATYRVAAGGRGLGWIWAATLNAHSSFGHIVFPNIGAYPDPPDDLALSIRLPADSDNIVPTDSTLQFQAALTHSGEGQTVYVSEGVLRIAGAHEWESGRNALPVSGQTVETFPVAPDSNIQLSFAGLSTGSRLSSGPSPSSLIFDTCNGVSTDGATDWTCTVELDGASIYIPIGTPSGTFAISGAITVNGREYTDTLEITIVEPGSIDEVAEIRFDFAEQERGPNRGEPYPANIPLGGNTKFRLAALNENGTASAAGSISSILLTTTIGSLSANLGGCSNAIACAIPPSAITAANADKIDVTLSHADPSKAGRGQVSASVITADGEAFSPPPLTVILAGEAASLTISEPTTRLLNFAAASDSRDALTLTVTAADAAGNSVAVPYRAPRARIIGPDDEVVSSGINVAWTEDGDDSDAAHDQFTRNAANAVTAAISVTADAVSPLAAGDYTLELRTAGITTTRGFTVVGGADSITIAPPETAPAVGALFTLTASVRDAAGAPVPDGTPVTWNATTIGDSVALVVATPRSTTENGVATANFYTVNPGTAAITATADGLAAVRRVDISPDLPLGMTPGVSASAAASVAAGLSNTDPNAYAVWLGADDTLASSILDSLSGVAAIHYRLDGRWFSYGVADGSPAAGSRDAPIPTGAILWLTG